MVGSRHTTYTQKLSYVVSRRYFQVQTVSVNFTYRYSTQKIKFFFHSP